ncbi:MAG: hypothetical protein QW625_01550, partial [Candidatus Nanoarchaeia archaeon]
MAGDMKSEINNLFRNGTKRKLEEILGIMSDTLDLYESYFNTEIKTIEDALEIYKAYNNLQKNIIPLNIKAHEYLEWTEWEQNSEDDEFYEKASNAMGKLCSKSENFY